MTNSRKMKCSAPSPSRARPKNDRPTAISGAPIADAARSRMPIADRAIDGSASSLRCCVPRTPPGFAKHRHALCDRASRNIRPIGTFAIANSRPYGIATLQPAQVTRGDSAPSARPERRRADLPADLRRTAPRHSRRPPAARAADSVHARSRDRPRRLAAAGIERLRAAAARGVSRRQNRFRHVRQREHSGSSAALSGGRSPDAGVAAAARAARERAVPNQPSPTSWSFPVVPFQVGLPALDLFPHAAWAKLVARQVRAETPEQLAYGDPAGLRGLRVAIAEHLRASRAVRCVADQVLIVPGSQAALRLAAATLLEPNDRVADRGARLLRRASRVAGRRRAARPGAGRCGGLERRRAPAARNEHPRRVRDAIASVPVRHDHVGEPSLRAAGLGGAPRRPGYWRTTTTASSGTSVGRSARCRAWMRAIA